MYLIKGYHYDRDMAEMHKDYKDIIINMRNEFGTEMDEIKKETRKRMARAEDRLMTIDALMDKHILGPSDSEKRNKFKDIIQNADEIFLNKIYNAQKSGNFSAIKGELVSHVACGMAGKPEQWAQRKSNETASIDPVLMENEFRKMITDRLLVLNRPHYEPIFNKGKTI